MITLPSSRRGWLKAAGASVLGMVLAGCDRIAENPKVLGVIDAAEGLNRRAQRLLASRRTLAPEFSRASISRDFRANGTTNPADDDYRALAEDGFAGWRLVVDGLVDHPLSLSLDQVRALPARTQVTRHDCVEGWSGIAEWKGARMTALLAAAGLKPTARYIVLHCADTFDAGAPEGQRKYYESLDLVDALHPQTILAYEMNGETLAIPHGAPLRLRAEKHLGYKQAKYVMRVEAVDSLDHIGAGKGGFWPDRGYERYAGI
ncbi:MAG: molybdopterin-dependent oxidoreductase [Proteobacteria bacterium]|nr:molybdopterin-dependent oxidoreductase [Pseudomonadota bacterium]